MKPAITDITGIGPAAATALGEHGFSSLKALASADVAQLSAVPGFSAARAQKTIAAAAALLASPTAEAVTPDNPGKAGKEKKKKDKDKKGKKGKGKKGKGKKKK